MIRIEDSANKFKLNVNQKIVLFVLLLAGMNFLNGFYYFIFLAFILLVIIQKKLYSFSVMLYAFFAVSVLLSIIVWGGSVVAAVKEGFYGIMCYFIGTSIFDNRLPISKQFEKISYLICLSVFVHFLLNAIINFQSSIFRNTIDIWTRTNMSATGQAALGSLFLAVCVSKIITAPKIIQKLLYLGCVLVIIGYSLKLASRSNLILLFLVVIAALVFEMFSGNKKKFFGIVILLSGIFCVLIIAYQYNLFGLRDAVMNSNFYLRFFDLNAAEAMFEDTRFHHLELFIDNFGLSVFGGSNIRDLLGNYAHNIFLDGYDAYGIICLISLILITVFSIIKLVAFMKNDRISHIAKSQVLCIYLALFFEMLSEPILQGLPIVFAVFCLINGMVERANVCS